ncbi:MAG TPA: MBL fold metallo-hydrolase [Mycobacteriales bacterium]|nr:MBL fold metallo-hydrolase [Mycobacteriales bacterium]
MAAVQMADGVWRIPLAPRDFLNAFLLEGDDGTLTLVDAGTKASPRRVLAALAQLGKAPQDVTHLLLSHAHNDHTGGAAAVQRATGSRVATHDTEAAYVREGRMPTPDSATWGGLLMARLPRVASGFARVDVDDTFTDGNVLPLAGDISVVHTPGHTPGHCSFLHRRSGVLLASDAIFNVRGLRYPFRSSCFDLTSMRASAARLGELDYDVAAFAHGPHVSTGARVAVRAFLAGRSS